MSRVDQIEDLMEELQLRLYDRLAKLEARLDEMDKLLHDIEWFVTYKANVLAIPVRDRIYHETGK